VTKSGRKSYSAAELGEVAAGIRRILVAIEAGELAADTRTVTRLEGAAAALEALAEGRSVT
jgi:hypothetical protein